MAEVKHETNESIAKADIHRPETIEELKNKQKLGGLTTEERLSVEAADLREAYGLNGAAGLTADWVAKYDKPEKKRAFRNLNGARGVSQRAANTAAWQAIATTTVELNKHWRNRPTKELTVDQEGPINSAYIRKCVLNVYDAIHGADSEDLSDKVGCGIRPFAEKEITVPQFKQLCYDECQSRRSRRIFDGNVGYFMV